MFIYRIFNNTQNYIGSTYDIKYRMYHHKSPSNICRSKIIIESGEYDVEILEECEDNMRLERGQYWMDRFVCVNSYNTYTTRKWDKDPKNKLKIKDYKKKRHQYLISWGGDTRRNNNLWEIDVNLFTE
jgi:hypothetical protein